MTTIDRHQFKLTIGIAIAVIIFIIVTSFQFATWKAEMQAQHKEFDDRITHVGEKVINIRAEITALNEKANRRDIELAKINTKLTSIETLLLEIKLDLKESCNK